MKNYFAANLRFLRKMSNMTQGDLAEVMNKRHTTIGNWEKNISKPNIEELIILADYFNVDVNTLLLKDIPSRPDTTRQYKKFNIEGDADQAALNSSNDFANQLIESLKISIQALQQAVFAKSAEIELLRNKDHYMTGE